MARNRNVPFKGRIQKRKTYHLQIITFGLQRAAGRGHKWTNFAEPPPDALMPAKDQKLSALAQKSKEMAAEDKS
jgi:hypothetical protein